MFELTAGEVSLAVLVLALALAGLWLLAVRRLRRAADAVDAAWAQLETVLVRHHAVVEELVSVTGAHHLLSERRREFIEHAINDVARTGSPEERARREARLHDMVTALDRVLAAETSTVAMPVRAAQRAYGRAWDETETVGERYDRLASGYNRTVRLPLVILAARRVGRVHAERFRPGPLGEDD